MPDYYFHPDIQSAYSAVHEWLAEQKETEGYKNISLQEAAKLLSEKTLKSAAAQYNVFFPGHYFKVIYTLENIVTSEKLLDWINTNQHILLIDIGCGAGAATIAFLERIISLRESEQFTNSLEIVCIGIDINPESLTIYKQLMVKVKNLLNKLNIKLTYTISGKSLQEVPESLLRFINKPCNQWGKPCISDAILLQSNVVSGLKYGFDSLQKHYKKIQKSGVSLDEILDGKNEFGIDEALAYKSLAQNAKIDNLHIITVGTKDYSVSVRKIAASLKLVFDKSGHTIEQYNEFDCKIGYENPLNSYWRDRGEIGYPEEKNKGFSVNFSTITNADLKQDKDWEKLIDLKNLEKAWVRARKYLKSESLPDEIEYRLFEINLSENLQRLQEQLKVYIKEFVNSEDDLHYKFPKNLSQSRPRSLSRLEGEILSTAIIQKFGKKASLLNGNSYAYRVSASNRETEYLYNPWFTLYRDFLAKVCTIAQQKENQNGVIICVDIESFYTRIIQDRLIELTGKELTESKRIRWLLKLLLSKNLDEHEIGYGITQGNIGSGFYANLYLKSIDDRFGIEPKDNEWGVKLIRYVDDIIFIIPNKDDEKEVLQTLKEELKKLGLKLNESKTERYDNVSDFEETRKNELLTKLSNDFYNLVNPLWICNHRYRQELIKADKRDNDYQWWYLIRIYQKCLCSIEIYIDVSHLSREIYRYLWDDKKGQKGLKEKPELKLPTLIDDINDEEIHHWARIFHNYNYDWIEKKNLLRQELIKLFVDSWGELANFSAQPDNREKISKTKKLKSCIRFAFNRLSKLGLEEIKEMTVDILCEQPWIFSKLLQVLESLSKQGYNDGVVEVIAYYENNSLQISEYIRAVSLRAFRFSSQINEDIWEKIVEYSVGGASTVEKLMATESWLDIGHLSYQYVEDSQIKSISNALRNEQNNRLKKNYILILAMYDNQAMIEESIDSSDYMVKAAYDIALEGSESVEELLSNKEPKVIRKYYSGKDGEVDY